MCKKKLLVLYTVIVPFCTILICGCMKMQVYAIVFQYCEYINIFLMYDSIPAQYYYIRYYRLGGRKFLSVSANKN